MSAAAILAGGRAERLGGAVKALLPLGRARIIDLQIAAVAPAVDRVFIVANDPNLFVGLGLEIVPDRATGGAIGGLYTAIDASGEDSTLVLACDLPFVTRAFVARLLDERARHDVVLPRTREGYHPLCACWNRSTLGTIGAQIAADRRRIVDVLPALRVCEIGPDEVMRFDPEGMLLFNVNTPHDYARAQSYHDRLNS
jgi:molybdenum cofactor guanylyltransferase